MTRRIAVIDDHGLIRDGLAHLLPQVEITGTYPDLPTFLAATPSADVVLLDLDLAGLGDETVVHGAAAVAQVTSAGYRVLIYTAERRRGVLVGCVAAGAAGVVHKAEPVDELTEAIETVAAGGVVITTALAGLAELYARRGELPELTPRQLEVLAAKARGTTNRTIAERLHLSVRTVEYHVATIARVFADYLQTHSPADLERHLGTGDGDLLDPRATL